MFPLKSHLRILYLYTEIALEESKDIHLFISLLAVSPPVLLPLLGCVEEGVQRALEAAGQVAVPPEALHSVAVLLGRPLQHHQGRLLQGRG